MVTLSIGKCTFLLTYSSRPALVLFDILLQMHLSRKVGPTRLSEQRVLIFLFVVAAVMIGSDNRTMFSFLLLQ